MMADYLACIAVIIIAIILFSQGCAPISKISKIDFPKVCLQVTMYPIELMVTGIASIPGPALNKELRKRGMLEEQEKEPKKGDAGSASGLSQ
jgi:hypothetical protein